MIKRNLADTTIPDIVLELYYSRQSGILRLTQGDVTKKLYFKDGSVVFAHSSLASERLGEILLRLGKITEDEFKVVLREVEGGKRLGTALMERGFVSSADVTAGVNYQLQQIIYSVFNWSEGDCEFTERDRPVFEDIMVNVSTPEILLDGIRNITNLTVLLRGIGDDDNTVITANTGIKKIKRANLDFAEETILACLGEKCTIEKLKSMSHLAPHEFGRAMYSLLISGILAKEAAPAQPEERLRAAVQQRWLSLTTDPGVRDIPKEPISRIKTASETELRQMIVEAEKRYRTTTDEEVLGVLPGCTRDEVQTAYDRLTALYHPLYYSENRYQDLKDQLKFILDRLAGAYDGVKESQASQRPLSELPVTEKFLPAEPSSSSPVPDAEQSSSGARDFEFQTPVPEPEIPPQTPERPRPTAPTAPEVSEGKEIPLSELEAALKRDPNSCAVMRQLGRKLQQAGRARDGEKLLLRALDLEPQSIDNHFALADFYQAQGLKFKAFKHLNVILQIQPNNEKAMEHLGIKKRTKGLYEISGRNS
jgi:tetratricopeptide (TPR) repeat protein